MNRNDWLPKTVLTVILGLVFVLNLGGCGYKTPPLPPEAVVPQAITDLRATITDAGLLLEWSYPRRTIRGRNLARIDNFELYRAEVPLDQVCADCPLPFGRPLIIAGGELDPKEGRTGHYDYTNLRPGHTYSFKILARTSWWAAGHDSNIISITWPPPDKNEPEQPTPAPSEQEPK